MVTNVENENASLDSILQALEKGWFVEVYRALQRLKSAEIALLLESTPTQNRKIIWSLVDPEQQGEILEELSEEIIEGLALAMPPKQLAQALHRVETDDLAYILRHLPNAFSEQLLDEFESTDRIRAQKALSYEEDTAGALMSTDVVTISVNMSIADVLQFMRRKKKLPEHTDKLYVVDEQKILIGELPLATLVTANPQQQVSDVLHQGTEQLTEKQKKREIAALFARHDLISAPVIGENGSLIGRITIDDVVDIVRNETEHDMMGMAKMDVDTDTFASTWSSVKRRGIWLGVNMVAAFTAASVSNMFEKTFAELATLAVLMTIVPSMGGIAGNQTLALIIRGIALGHISHANSRWLITKEALVGLINGLTWALIIASIVFIWKQNLIISLVIAAAMLINMTVAGLIGALIPLGMRRFGIDPALAGSMALSTITDIVGLLSFLGLATLFI